MPTRILKSRIFKKYPAARFSSLTWLRSLDARARLPTRTGKTPCVYRVKHSRVHAYTLTTRKERKRVYVQRREPLRHYTRLSYISVNALSYTGLSTEKFDFFPFFLPSFFFDFASLCYHTSPGINAAKRLADRFDASLRPCRTLAVFRFDLNNHDGLTFFV